MLGDRLREGTETPASETEPKDLRFVAACPLPETGGLC